jgi:hypothetical protein
MERAANRECSRGLWQRDLGPVLQPERHQQRHDPEDTQHRQYCKAFKYPAGLPPLLHGWVHHGFRCGK